MPEDYDEQLIEATAVRRARLVRALLHGPERLRRTWTDRVGTHLAGAFLAVLACAVCIAVAFVIHLFSTDSTLQRNRQGVGPMPPSPEVVAAPAPEVRQ